MSKIPRHIRVAKICSIPTQFQTNTAWGLKRDPPTANLSHSDPCRSHPIQCDSSQQYWYNISLWPRQVAKTDFKKDESTRHHLYSGLCYCCNYCFHCFHCWLCCCSGGYCFWCTLVHFSSTYYCCSSSNGSLQHQATTFYESPRTYAISMHQMRCHLSAFHKIVAHHLECFMTVVRSNDATLYPDIANPS